ncbi:MAG: cardiolipin synthase [Firmicutes bacterium]|nr:cardiolipin synthase [Bacillota bacterium]
MFPFHFEFGFINFGTLLLIVDIVMVFVIIFLERKTPAATAAWIMIMLLLPVLGIILYIIFSQNIARKKIFKLTHSEETYISASLKSQINDMKNGKFDYSDGSTGELWEDMITLNVTYAKAYYTQDNDVDIFTDGTYMFSRLLDDIKKAKNSVNVMYFIVKNDIVGRRLIDTLTEKAKEGVEVRFLVDAMGSRSINNYLLSDFIEAGGKVAYFFPPKLRYFNIKLNYRNHRKIVVLDNEIGYIGGFNIAKEYLGMKKKFGYWRDTHLRVTGSSVQDMNARFLMDWRFASGEDIPLEGVYEAPYKSTGRTGVQIVSSGPDSYREEVKRAYMKMITSAQRSVCLQTPYFIPDASIQESLKMAALSGVDVKVMIPCMPDHVMVYWATYWYVGDLLKSGVRVFIYDNGFLHAKTIVADGEVASVGSANFDRRSFALNFEANAFVYDSKVAGKLEDRFADDMTFCHELTLDDYQKRSGWIQFKETIARLLSDIL